MSHLTCLISGGFEEVSAFICSEEITDLPQCVGYLPPYSPDFNPIEMAFSKLKALLRKVAARTREELDAAIANAIKNTRLTSAQTYFTACGYESE